MTKLSVGMRILIGTTCLGSLPLAMTVMSGSVHAQTLVWNGAQSNWFIAANWTPPGIPGPTSDAVISSGSALIDVEGAQAQSLTIDGAGGLVIAGAATTGGIGRIDVLGTGGLPVFFLTETASLADTVVTVTGSGQTVFNDAVVVFFDTSKAGTAILTTSNQALVAFAGNSDAEQANISNNQGGLTVFDENATAGTAHITNNAGGGTAFGGSATADRATIVNNSGSFVDIAETSLTGGAGRVAIGSLSGAGRVYLGASELVLGGLNGNDQLSGPIFDGFSPEITSLTGNPIVLTGGRLTKIGTGTLTLSGNNSYTGATTVSGGTLAAGAMNTFSPGSAHNVSSGATLALNGFDQTVLSLSNAGIVSTGGAPGTTLATAGSYTGLGGVLALNTTLGGDNSPTDRLVIGGDSLGTTIVRVTNVGGTGAPTHEGIKVIDVAGASSGAFTLQGDYVFNGQQAIVAGAYGYQLYKNQHAERWGLVSSFRHGSTRCPTLPAGRTRI